MNFTISSSSSQYPMIEQLNQVEQQFRKACNVKNRHCYELSVKPSDIQSAREGKEKVTAPSKEVIEEATEVSKLWENSSAQEEDFQELKILVFLLRCIQSAREATQVDTFRNRIALKKHLENIKENIGKLPKDPNISPPSKIVRGLNNLYIALNNGYIEFGKLFLMGALLVIGVALKILMAWPFAMISLVAVLCSCVLLRESIHRQSEKITQQIADYEYKVVTKQALSEMLGTAGNSEKIPQTVTRLMNQATEQKKQAKEVFEDQIKQFYKLDNASSRQEKSELIAALRKSLAEWKPTDQELIEQLAHLEATKQVLKQKFSTIQTQDSQDLIYILGLDKIREIAENKLDELNKKSEDVIKQALSQMWGTPNKSDKITDTVDQLMKEAKKVSTAFFKDIENAFQTTEQGYIDLLAYRAHANSQEGSGLISAFFRDISDAFQPTKQGSIDLLTHRAVDLMQATADTVILLKQKLSTIQTQDSQALIHTLDQVMATAENKLNKLNQSAVDVASRQLHKEIVEIGDSFDENRKSHLSKFPAKEQKVSLSNSPIQLA